VVQIRQIAMYLSQKYTDTSLSRIGTMIGKRNHATVLHATKIISGLLENDKQLQKDMQEIEALVKQR
jgi:chromosomal replication initiator protein